MGARRSPPEQPRRPQESGAQAAVAVALVSTVGASPAAFVAALAPLLLPFFPLALLSTAVVAEEIAVGAARLLARADAVPVPASGFGRTAAMEAISYRAAYAEAAVRRLCAAVEGAEPGGEAEALRKALRTEERHLAAHLEATRRRLAGARVTDAMIELHGWILNWRWGQTRTPSEPRPTHKAADGANVDLRRGVPASVIALPGVLPWCSCAWGPPVRGARTIA